MWGIIRGVSCLQGMKVIAVLGGHVVLLAFVFDLDRLRWFI